MSYKETRVLAFVFGMRFSDIIQPQELTFEEKGIKYTIDENGDEWEEETVYCVFDIPKNDVIVPFKLTDALEVSVTLNYLLLFIL